MKNYCEFCEVTGILRTESLSDTQANHCTLCVANRHVCICLYGVYGPLRYPDSLHRDQCVSDRPYALTSSCRHVGGTIHCFVRACDLRLAHF